MVYIMRPKYCCNGIIGDPTWSGEEEAPIELQRTLKIPVHHRYHRKETPDFSRGVSDYAITKKKLGYLDNLTARLTYAVRL